MTNATGLPNDELSRRCAEETEKFSRRREHDTQFCYELLRRALAEESHEAFTHIYQIYERQTLIWVHSHSRFEQTGEEAEYFARAALSAWYFRLRGPGFAGFGTLAQALAYLKTCIHSAIMQYLRDQKSADHTLDAVPEPGEEPDMDEGAVAAAALARIDALLADERSRRLARYVFVQDLAPRQVLRCEPGVWRDEREVTVALYRIRQVLRNDPELQELLGRA